MSKWHSSILIINDVNQDESIKIIPAQAAAKKNFACLLLSVSWYSFLSSCRVSLRVFLFCFLFFCIIFSQCTLMSYNSKKKKKNIVSLSGWFYFFKLLDQCKLSILIFYRYIYIYIYNIYMLVYSCHKNCGQIWNWYFKS